MLLILHSQCIGNILNLPYPRTIILYLHIVHVYASIIAIFIQKISKSWPYSISISETNFVPPCLYHVIPIKALNLNTGIYNGWGFPYQIADIKDTSLHQALISNFTYNIYNMDNLKAISHSSCHL